MPIQRDGDDTNDLLRDNNDNDQYLVQVVFSAVRVRAKRSHNDYWFLTLIGCSCIRSNDILCARSMLSIYNAISFHCAY